MDSVVFFRHRHKKEKKELANCFATGNSLQEATKKKLLLTQAYDFRESVLKEVRTKPMFSLFDKKNIKESFNEMLNEDGGVFIAEQKELFPMFLKVKKEGGFNVNFIDAYMLDGDKVVAEQIYMINKNNVYIMMISTKPSYQRQGIANNLLSQVEHIVFDLLKCDAIISTATHDSRKIFERRGYNVSKCDHLKQRDGFSTIEAEVSLSRKKYLEKNKEMGK